MSLLPGIPDHAGSTDKTTGYVFEPSGRATELEANSPSTHHVERQLAWSAATLEAVGVLQNCDTQREAGVQIANLIDELLVREGSANKKMKRRILVAGITESDTIQLLADSSGKPVKDSSISEWTLAAMAECRARGGAAFFPAASTQFRQSLCCHRQLAEQAGVSHVCSLQLDNQDGVGLAMVTILGNSPFCQDEINLLTALQQPLGSAFHAVRRGEGNRVSRWLHSIKTSWQNHRTRNLVKLGGALLLASLIPTPYTVKSDCELIPGERRFVSAPFDSKLEACFVEPGDLVSADQVLAQLDEQEIKLELAQIEADYERARKNEDGYLVSQESGEAKLANLEAKSLFARQQLLQYRENHLELRSQIDGMVIAGDLKDARGMPLKTGEKLFEVAPLEQLKVDLLLETDDVRYISAGDQVRIRLDAFPFESFTATIDRINPIAEVRDTRSVFVCKATLENPTGRLRPGMQGRARTRGSWQPLIWQFARRPLAKSLRWLGW